LPTGWETSGFNASDWKQALEVRGPGGAFKAEQSIPLAVAETYRPVHITHPKSGVTVYDLGENMSGWPEIVTHGEAGSRIRLLCGELLSSDGTVTQRSASATPDDPVLFNYTLRGAASGESWHPRFSYYSFRFVQVTTEAAHPGAPLPVIGSVTGDFVHAAVLTAGSFRSSDVLFNRIHTLIDRAVLSNLASVLTDCPSREKLGWLEQTYLNASTLMLNYDVARLYEKLSADIADAQLPDGLVPSIAPEYVQFVDGNGQNTPFRDSPEWGSAIVLSPWALYQFTGDPAPLVRYYPGMQRYVAYLGDHTKGNLLDYGLGDWYDIGPKPPGESQLTSRAVTATGTYYEDLTVLAKIARLLGHAADASDDLQKADSVRRAFNARFFDPAINQYDSGSQTANALPLALGMVPIGHEQAVLAHLVEDVHEHGNHVTAGDIGFHYVVRALTDFKRSDVLAAMFSRNDSPSYGYQLARGATTLTEAWDANPHDSQNHFMLGDGEEWFYSGLAGLSIDMSRGADDAVLLHPSLLPGVASASADYDAPLGLLSVAWRRSGNAAWVHVAIPPGAQARVMLPPSDTWMEGKSPIERMHGSLSLKRNADGYELKLGSGSYHFFTKGLSASPSNQH
jgi:alpha-L-rhamnosidase